MDVSANRWTRTPGEIESDDFRGRTAERRTPDPENPAKLVPADAVTLQREMVTILSAFDRFSAEQIASVLVLPLEAVKHLRRDPEVLDMIALLKSVLPRPGDLHELLMSDAEKNIRWLQRLRDGLVDGTKIDDRSATALRVRARAAEVLLDRQVAKKVEIQATPIRTIDITDAQMERMRGLIGDGAVVQIEATPPPPNDTTPHQAFTDADVQ